MRIENGQLVLDEMKRCYGCHHVEGQDEDKGSGIVADRVPCSTCKGTRRGKRGGRNGCKDCYDGREYSKTSFHPCSNCDGTGLVPETIYDRIPDEMWVNLSFKVYRRPARMQTWGERYLGLGCYSVEDYGRHHNMTDEELIEEVRDPRHAPQACKLVKGKDDLTFASEVAIVTAKGGYAVIGVVE